MIFETHIHLNDPEFKDNYIQLIKEAQNEGVTKFIVVGYDLESSKIAVKLANKHPFIYAAVGLHPSEQFNNYDNDLIELETLINNKVVAIGEIGLDYHYVPSDKDRQTDLFVKQLKLAQKYDLPIIIHSRDACNDTYNILKKYKDCYNKGVMHCYSYSLEMTKEFKKLNFVFGIGGVITYKNGKSCKEVASNLSLEDIVLETDAPYLSPVPYRGKTNEPRYIKYVAKEISQLKNISLEEVENTTYKTACNLFGVDYEN